MFLLMSQRQSDICLEPQESPPDWPEGRMQFFLMGSHNNVECDSEQIWNGTSCLEVIILNFLLLDRRIISISNERKDSPILIRQG